MTRLWLSRPLGFCLATLCMAGLFLLTSCELPWNKFNALKTPQATSVAGETAPTKAADSPAAPAETATAPIPGDFRELSASDFSGSSDALSGLILFSSTSGDPFEKLDVGAVEMAWQESYLWGISPDGKRGGRISPQDEGSAIFLSRKEGAKPRIVDYGIQLAGDAVDLVSAPEDCSEQTCGGFQFSPDGRFLAYFVGPAESCGRTLKLMEVRTRLTFHTWKETHAAYFLNDGSLVVVMGGCDRQIAYLYIPNTDRQSGIGDGAIAGWNPGQEAVLWQSAGQLHQQPALWGFNRVTSKVFLWTTKDLAIEDSPAWTPDGRHFLFQLREFTFDDKTGDSVLTGARQVILMDAWTRSQRLLTMDGEHDYHLCQSAGEPCNLWSGDWIQVRRTPYKSTRIRMEDRGTSAARCALYGLDCDESPELYALNWKTGELLPWADAGVTDPTPLPDYTPANLQSEPVYEDPQGAFAFYTSADGHHLWYVPQGGEPELWVKNGQGFVYIP